MRSHAILRTNVGLTTNAKIMVTGSYSLYVDAIISNSELSSVKYKRKEFNKSNYWDEILPYFFKNTPPETAYFIKDDEDNKNMSKDFANQYDDIYQYGARNIIENKDYTEEFEYFAPLHISKTGLPKNFIIFRVDGPGIINLTKENFKDEILNKLKCVKIFDMTRNSALGEWIETNIIKNKNFPQTGLYIDFRDMEFSSWIGIDYEDGGYSEKSYMLDAVLKKELTYQDFEKFILDGYKNNKVVYPHILNLSFLFDDTPATPTSIRTWSLNRYLGFYLDALELVKYVSPYILPKMKSDVVIDENNILYSVSEVNPFEETFKRQDNLYLEIGGEIYKVEKYLEQQPSVLTRVQVSRNTFVERPNQSFLTKYKIISNISLAGRQSEINKNIIFVDSSSGLNKMTDINGLTYNIENFDDADVWMIEIDGKFHNLIKSEGGDMYINTDYAFSQSLEKFDYYINDPIKEFRKSISLIVDLDNAPKKFGIYRCKFTDIKDFDLDIVDTEYSKFEYIYKERLTQTDETKMYAVNQNSTSFPKDLDDFKINGEVVNIPASSEYTANSELFRLIDKDLNFLWKKNAKRVKWGFQNSISSNDYPYLLNNSFNSEDYNRTTNPFNPSPIREERNLDYFLTINPNSNQFSHHSLHVVDEPEISFTFVSRESTFAKLDGVSDIGYFNDYDIISISASNYSYGTPTRVRKISSSSNGYSLIVDSPFVFSSATVSGTLRNLTRTSFSLEKYLNINYSLDYFTYFFGKKTEFDSGTIIKNTQKWSYFNSGDNSIPNITLFRGLKFKIWDVGSVKIKDSNIEAINIKSNNNYEDYKFSILLSKNNYSVKNDYSIPNGATVSFMSNLMKWQIIDEWKHDKIYSEKDLVKYNDTIYVALRNSQILDPAIFPFDSPDWQIYQPKNIFWNPVVDGTSFTTTKNNMLELGKTIFGSSGVIPPLVFNNNEYYYSSGNGGINFWNPGVTYSLGDIVFYQDKVWISRLDNNRRTPNVTQVFVEDAKYKEWWFEAFEETPIWTSVELWNAQTEYLISNSKWTTNFSRGHYVVYQDVVYATINDCVRGVIPPLDSNWNRIYSLSQDTNFQYGGDFNGDYNPIIKMNNRLYFCRENGYATTRTLSSGATLGGGKGSVKNTRTITTYDSLSTLENGINIYINRKWKNVLINIYINDNTYTTTEEVGIGLISFKKDNLSNNNRESLYTDIYSKISANNFMNAINDLSNYYDFSDKIRYIIINEDLSLQIYDFNDLNTVTNLPTLLTCEGPDEFLVQIDSLAVEPTTLAVSEIKPKRSLQNGEITSLSELNYFSDNSLATTIRSNPNDPFKVSNYSSLKNNLYNNLFRQSGYYSPIFNTIELYKNSTLTQSGGNYKFDTDLTNFGKIKERIISKINRDKNILKLKNNPDLLSVYPMLDEFGYQVTSFYIFKSTWDIEYHIECQEVPQTNQIMGNQSLQFSQPTNLTNNINLDLL